MTIYPDSFYKTQWLHCKECKESGDLLNLAASIWEVDEGTVARNLMSKQIILRHHNFDENLKAYQKKWLDIRKKHNAFWIKAKQSTLMYESTEIRAALRGLGLSVPANIATWRNGIGRLVGAATKLEAETAIAMPRLIEDRINHVYKGTGEYRIFIGNWAEDLVVPYFDLPGRIREFRFIGHDGKSVRYAHKFLSHRRLSSRVAALAFMDPVLDTNPNNIVVVDNLEAGLVLQAKHSKDSPTLLPLVVASDITCINHLKHLAPRTFTVWNPMLSGEIFKSFKEPNIDLCVDDKNSLDNVSALNKFSPKVWMDKVNNSRRSCLDVLDNWLIGVNRIEAEASVGLMDLTPLEIAQVREDRYPNIHNAMRALPCIGGKTVLVHGEEYFENENGWFAKKDGTQVTSIRVRIELIATNGKDSKVFGHVRGKGMERTPFTGDSRSFQSNAIKFIENAMFIRGITGFTVNRKYRAQFKDIAIAFSSPRWISEYTKAGWDSGGNVFRFAHFFMDKNGVVVDYDNTFKRNNSFHTFNLKHEEVNASELFELMEDTDTNRGFWVVLSSLLSSIISPAISGKSEMYLCTGESDKNFENLCSWLGVTVAGKKENEDTGGTWPVIFTKRKRAYFVKELSSLIYSEIKPPCIVEVDSIEANLARLIKKATVMHVELGVKVEELQERARKILPALMSWILSTYGLALDHPKDFVTRIIELAKEWAVSLGCIDTCAIDNCSQCFTAMESEDTEAILRSFKVCCQFGLDKRLFVVGAFKSVKIVDELVYIKKCALVDLLRLKGFKAVDGLDLQPALNATIVGLSPDPSLTKDYMVVSRDWWTKAVGEDDNLPAIRLAR